jgi:integrase
MVADFAAHRQASGLQISSVNSSLQVLRRTLRLAVEWEAVQSSPSIKMLPGARRRERVVTLQDQVRYLGAALEPLCSVAEVLVETALRPEECFRLRWEAITWTNGRHGTLLVTHGKTAAARRVLPMTPRVRNVIEFRWDAAGKPIEGWVAGSGLLRPVAGIWRVQASRSNMPTPQEQQGVAVRALFAAAYLFDTTRRIWLRRVDSSAHSRAQLGKHVHTVCSSF